MGIDNAAARMTLLLKSIPEATFDSTVTFGRQKNYIGSALRGQISRELKIPKADLKAVYADGFLSGMGATNLQFLDFSSYEDATVIQDLNVPIESSLREQFSIVMDIGTSEHVYNVAQSLQNIKDLCKPNGHVLIVSPANSHLGHGFYQFSPELFFRTFDEEHGFELKSLYLIKKRFFGEAWYKLTDPKNAARRGTIYTRKRCYIAAIAAKKPSQNVSAIPQQSDYVDAWQEKGTSSLGALYRKVPPVFRKLIDVTLIPILSRYRSRLTPARFHWQNGRYESR